MITLILFLLATIGLANILVHGRILDVVKIFGRSIRGWMGYWDWSKQLFDCYECTGFWAGLICGITIMSQEWHMVLMYGFVGSVVAQTFTDFIFWLRGLTQYEVEDGE